jgi:3',5'-cyclic-AMP phosphodiesterase
VLISDADRNVKIAVLAVRHLMPATGCLSSPGPAARLGAAMGFVERHHRSLSFVRIAGGFAHSGARAEYEALKDSLSAVDIPATGMMGNYDRRRSCRDVVPRAYGGRQGLVQPVRQFDPTTVVTSCPVHDSQTGCAGRLCDGRLVCLESSLRSAPRDWPIYRFCITGRSISAFRAWMASS